MKTQRNVAYPMCWMTKGAIIHVMWPEGTTYDHLSTDESFANDGKFLKALDAILLPRTTSVCESEDATHERCRNTPANCSKDENALTQSKLLHVRATAHVSTSASRQG